MKMTKAVQEQRQIQKDKPVTNFMGGTSYEVNPLLALKMVTASSIFGEPQYYRKGEFAEKNMKNDGRYLIHPLCSREEDIVLDKRYNGMNTSEIMEDVIDKALDYDFKGTLDWAATLRHEYFMRLNPQIIMVRAAMHPCRAAFNEANPGYFRTVQECVMRRADEPAVQFTYWLYRKKSKRSLPSILKRSWADRYESADLYELAKYKNKGLGMIDTIRVCHANSGLINELMKDGTIEVKQSIQLTWEKMRSEGASWQTIVDTIKLPHMALLRNLVNIFTEIKNAELAKKLLEQLKSGVLHANQFPFRYMTAMNAVRDAKKINHATMIYDALEACMDISLGNLPNLKGVTAVLSDNSGSAWGQFTSEYGETTVAEINNLSSVLIAQKSDEGTVFKFGDKVKAFSISKRNGALIQAQQISSRRDGDVGGSTEHGIWLFFDEAIKNNIHYDNIVIFSDQQAGHGGLYGTDFREYPEYAYGGRHIDVTKLIKAYRSKVNPKVNVYSVQTAGYDNVVIPEQMYRTSILYGWTGKELLYIDAMNKLWDSL